MSDITVRLVLRKRWFFPVASFIAWALLRCRAVKPKRDASFASGYASPEQRVGRWLLGTAVAIRVE